MNKIVKGLIGAVGLTLALSACGTSYTQSDADALGNRLRDTGFTVSGKPKVDSERVGKRTKRKLEVMVVVDGCLLEAQQNEGNDYYILDEWIEKVGNRTEEKTITDFSKRNPSVGDSKGWVKDHKQRKLINC